MLNAIQLNVRCRGTRSTLFVVRSFLALCGLMLACGVPGQVLAEEAQAVEAKAERGVVKIDNFTFSPATLTVALGTTVTWTNDDDIPHTVMAKDKAFRSKPLDTGNQFSFTFATPGEYAYFCSLHPHMVGKVIVKATDAGEGSH
jgi:plastocyanin